MSVDPVPPVPEAQLAHIPLPVVACPDCGSLGVRPVHHGEGAVPGAADLMTERTCPRCGYRGPPIEFESRESYAAFVRELNE